MAEQELIVRAREKKEVQEISENNFKNGHIRTNNTLFVLIKKSIISVKRGKIMLSMDQLIQVVVVLMKNLYYILFRPKSNGKKYRVLLFWGTHVNDKACNEQKAQIRKQEASAISSRWI